MKADEGGGVLKSTPPYSSLNEPEQAVQNSRFMHNWQLRVFPKLYVAQKFGAKVRNYPLGSGKQSVPFQPHAPQFQTDPLPGFSSR